MHSGNHHNHNHNSNRNPNHSSKPTILPNGMGGSMKLMFHERKRLLGDLE